MICKIVRIDDEGRMPLDQFADLIDISKVHYYEFETVDQDRLILRFYDENQELIPLKINS